MIKKGGRELEAIRARISVQIPAAVRATPEQREEMNAEFLALIRDARKLGVSVAALRVDLRGVAARYQSPANFVRDLHRLRRNYRGAYLESTPLGHFLEALNEQ